MFWIIAIIWYVTGSASFIYWYTKDFDINLTVENVIFILMSGIIGPLAFFFGWMIHGDPMPRNDYILFKKRKR